MYTHLLYRNKSIRVFMVGDYELLCKMYGISGASGMHPMVEFTDLSAHT